ncbi:hypothetical protein G6L37_00540 [Agrobacterium rubi]|nr:hypothetical protein [Agrobacterium rubi]NTF23877.1 hypothetical protein [Agrobacterium rubi]
MTERTVIKVAYSYYRYNDGSANNGDVNRERTCKTAEEAIGLADRINAIAARYKAACNGDDSVTEEQEWEDRDLANDLIDGACGGYLHPGAVAYVDHIRRERLSPDSEPRQIA